MASLNVSNLAPPPSRYLITGYPSLAAFIASDPDRTAGIYKRFDRLAARNLLYLQSELADLQAELDVLDEKDKADRASKQCARNWHDFKKRAEQEPSRLQLVNDIRATLKEYREALFAEEKLASMPHPDKKTLNAFRFTFFHGRPGDSMSFPTLGGSSKWVYDDANDLVATKNPAEQDRLSMFIQDNFAFLFKEYRPSKDNLPTHSDSVRYISGRRISVFASYISTVLVSMLLIGAVVILYLVPSSNVRLGLISLFTVLFANSVALLTNARRTEVFGVTAAYAAVLVVFVSGNLGSSQ